MSITLAILIVTGLISYQALQNEGLKHKLMHYPVAEHRNKEYYRLLSSGFVHGSMNHLLINGFVLYMFGSGIESLFSVDFKPVGYNLPEDGLYGPTYGPTMFLVLYLSAIIVGDLPTHFKHKHNPNYSALGASGATSAIVMVYVLVDPWAWFIYPPAPAILFGVGYIAYSIWADRTNRADGIGHSAHLYGALWGVVFFFVTQPEMISHFFESLMQPKAPNWFN